MNLILISRFYYSICENYIEIKKVCLIPMLSSLFEFNLINICISYIYSLLFHSLKRANIRISRINIVKIVKICHFICPILSHSLSLLPSFMLTKWCQSKLMRKIRQSCSGRFRRIVSKIMKDEQEMFQINGEALDASLI